MTFQPQSYEVFFRALGERYVRTALINGEFSGTLGTRAELWLKQRTDARGRTIMIWVGVFTVAATLAAALFDWASKTPTGS